MRQPGDEGSPIYYLGVCLLGNFLHYLTYVLFYTVKIDRSYDVRRNNSSQTFGGRAPLPNDVNDALTPMHIKMCVYT